jgi:hypothetical protein
MSRLACIPVLILCGSCGPPAVVSGGWQPDWMNAPPPLAVYLEIEPMKRAPVDSVLLQWDLSGEKGFRYAMSSTLSTEGETPMEVEGTVQLLPLGDGRAEVKQTIRPLTGPGAAAVKTFVVDEHGRIEEPDQHLQNVLQLIFPMRDAPLASGEMQEQTSLVPGAGTAETRGLTVLGIVGFSKVAGRTCAVVALDHEARVWAGEPLEQTGSERDLQLLGYFDVEAHRYVAVAIRDTTVHADGRSRTEQLSTYVLKGL